MSLHCKLNTKSDHGCTTGYSCPVLCLQYAPEKKVTKPKEEKGWWDRWFGSSDDEEEEIEVEIHEEKGTPF